MQILTGMAVFLFIATASQQFGKVFKKHALPLISGFLFAGIIAGPYVLGMISGDTVIKLDFIDDIALAFIAYAAGSELYLEEVKSRFKSIGWVTAGLVLVTFFAGSLTMLALAEYIPFMQVRPFASRVAIAILAGAILVARSPSSAIAIVNEVRAKGPFTKTVLGVTVVMDVVVIILFSINSSIADAILTSMNMDFAFIALLAGELLASLIMGYLLGLVLRLILSGKLHAYIKIGGVLLSGYGVFVLSSFVRSYSHENWGFEIFIEPLLICMIGSFIITNYSHHRDEFLKLLHTVSPSIYVAFFTLTGASLALNILVKTWPIALTLFVVRLIAIFIGSFSGGVIAGDPMKHNRISWMAYITQAGVGLGLAKEVAHDFPDWGAAFATTIISVIVLNQIIGPPFFKWAIKMVGEAHPKKSIRYGEKAHSAIIFGVSDQSTALAQRLYSSGWQVKVVCPLPCPLEMPALHEIEFHSIPDLSLQTLRGIGAQEANTLISMLSDEDNFRVCEIAYEHLGTPNLIVWLKDCDNLERFQSLGAVVIDPKILMTTLLDRLVRAPSSTSLMMGMEEDVRIRDFYLKNRELHEVLIRDLRFPSDVWVLSLRRDGSIIVPRGYTSLELNDMATISGTKESLEKIALLFEN